MKLEALWPEIASVWRGSTEVPKCILTIERVRRVESHTIATATWLPTSLSRTAKGERGYIQRGETQSSATNSPQWSNSYVPSPFVTISNIQIAQTETSQNINLDYILASKQQLEYPAYTQGRAQTCQVKKGMSPSCKHFLSGREHFLNPGATKPFLISPQTTADSGFPSLPTFLSH